MGPRGVEGHAWNAARIDRGWALLDITWDSGVLVPGPVLRFQKAYSGRFLFMRPEDFARSHLPDDESWQLLDRPVDATDFVKALPLSPTAARLGIGVLEPTRAYLETSQRQLEVVLDNPSRHPVGVRLVRDGAAPVRCEPQPGDARFRCALEFPALWQLQLYAAEGGHLVALAQGLVRTR
jgi:hypothetical protein